MLGDHENRKSSTNAQLLELSVLSSVLVLRADAAFKVNGYLENRTNDQLQGAQKRFTWMVFKACFKTVDDLCCLLGVLKLDPHALRSHAISLFRWIATSWNKKTTAYR